MADVFRQYHGDSLYLAAFAVSLAFLWWRDHKTRSGTVGKKAAAAVVLSIVFVFNEFAYRIVGRLTDATTYYRFFWMLPVLFVIAYVFTKVFTGSGNTGRLSCRWDQFVFPEQGACEPAEKYIRAGSGYNYNYRRDHGRLGGRPGQRKRIAGSCV